MQRLLLLGLNHSTAPLAVRERIAFDADSRRKAVESFRARFPEAELVLLSTCNRVELYVARAVHGHPRVEEMADFLAGYHGIPVDQIKPHLYDRSDRDVVEHLFRVASSLDSMVLGETQILGQVREAYEAASALGIAGSHLHPLFQRAMAVGKQVLSQTPIAEGRLSVAGVAVEYARRIFERFDDKTVLSVGAGKMGLLVLRHFAELSPGRLIVCTRDPAKAERVAADHGGIGASMEQLSECLAMADVVVCSSGSPQPIITPEMFEAVLKARRYRPIFLIDIALPRDVDERVGRLEHVYLYNLDDLQQVVASTRESRQDAISTAESLIRSAVDEYVRWQRTRELGPLIERLYERYHRIAQEEVARTLARMPDATPAQRQQMEELARRMVNKILHHPVQALRSGGGLHAPTTQYLHALEKLFRLELQVEDESDGGGEELPGEPR